VELDKIGELYSVYGCSSVYSIYSLRGKASYS